MLSQNPSRFPDQLAERCATHCGLAAAELRERGQVRAAAAGLRLRYDRCRPVQGYAATDIQQGRTRRSGIRLQSRLRLRLRLRFRFHFRCRQHAKRHTAHLNLGGMQPATATATAVAAATATEERETKRFFACGIEFVQKWDSYFTTFYCIGAPYRPPLAIG